MTEARSRCPQCGKVNRIDGAENSPTPTFCRWCGEKFWFEISINVTARAGKTIDKLREESKQ